MAQSARSLERDEAAMEDKETGRKEEKSSKNDRVALKKEIGLLSACAIIIGEFLRRAAERVAGGMTGGTWRGSSFKFQCHGAQSGSDWGFGSRSAVRTQ